MSLANFRKPSTKKVGLKVLAMGEKGSGKSVFALSFPKVYALDAETGMAFYENHPVYGVNLEGIANTQDFNELHDTIDELMESNIEGATFVIDSETKFYQNLTDAVLQLEEKKARSKGKDVMDSSVSMRGWGRVKSVATRLQNAKIDLSAKGWNIVSIAQIDDVKQKVGDEFVKIGEKAVMQKNSEYDYDLVIKLFTEVDGNGNTHYKGLILKDRTGVTKVNSVIDNPSYKIWQDFLDSRQNADKIESNLSKDHDKAIKTLEEKDKEAEKTVVDKLKDLMVKSENHKSKTLELVKKHSIKNPLQPKDEKELEVLGSIVEELEKL